MEEPPSAPDVPSGSENDVRWKRLRAAHAEAARDGRPSLCMSVQVGGLARQRRVNGEAVARALVEAAAGVLGETAGVERHLVARGEEDLRALLPGRTIADAPALADDLLARAKAVSVPAGDARAWLNLAIGVAHDAHLANAELATLVTVADKGAAVAEAGGGNRWAHTELYDLAQGDLRARAVVVPSRAKRGASGGAGTIRGKGTSDAEETKGSEVSATPEAPQAEPPTNERVQRLERRLAKLRAELDRSEARVNELEQAVQVETAGVPSAYGEVQGLDPDDAKFEQKRALMAALLEENLALRGRSGG